MHGQTCLMRRICRLNDTAFLLKPLPSSFCTISNGASGHSIGREIIVLNRRGTPHQRPESPMVTSPGMRVNTRYINSTKGTSSKKDASSGVYTLRFRHARRHRCVQAYDRTSFYSRPYFWSGHAIHIIFTYGTQLSQMKVLSFCKRQFGYLCQFWFKTISGVV